MNTAPQFIDAYPFQIGDWVFELVLHFISGQAKLPAILFIKFKSVGAQNLLTGTAWSGFENAGFYWHCSYSRIIFPVMFY